MSIKELFTAFMDAIEVDIVLLTFNELLDHITIDQDRFFSSLIEQVAGEISFKQRGLFNVLNEQYALREPFRLSVDHAVDVVVSGAGPCGLRAAVENAMLGFRVVVVEKRSTFSRANILTLWSQTMKDLVSLGAKYYFPWLKIHGSPLHLGTREIQIALMKTCLIFGVQFKHQRNIESVFLENGKRYVQVFPADKIKIESEQEQALGFKVNKESDYAVTFRCNMVDSPELDENFLTITESEEMGEIIPCDALFIAEGEWSSTLRKFGFEKTVDKFRQAIGLVINLAYDSSSKEEKSILDFTDTRFVPTWKDGVLGRLDDLGLECENIEYLKGSTHYAVVTITKNSLLNRSVLFEDKSTSAELLSKENLDLELLMVVGREIADACGIPSTAPFFQHNPVQIFDFSSRSRCRTPHKIMSLSEHTRLLDLTDEELGVFVFSVGDALLEPFWPQGLGSNRGFHSVLDSVFALYSQITTNQNEAISERLFSYFMMHGTAWSKEKVTEQENWTIDPISRYSPNVIKMILRDLRGRNKESEIPTRLESWR